MNQRVGLLFVSAIVIGISVGLLWTHAASGPAPAPVMSLKTMLAVSPSVVADGGLVAVSGSTTITGGPSPATVDVVYTGKGITTPPVRFQTILKRDGTWSFNLPLLPVSLSPGTGTLKTIVNAGGKIATDTVILTGTGGDFDCQMSAGARPWMYENDGAKTANRHTVTLTVAAVNNVPPEMGTPTYTYRWNTVTHPHTGKALVLVSGGGPNDTMATFAAPQAPAASTQPYVVTCEVVASYGPLGDQTALAATEVPVRLLGDANGDDKVTVTDFSVWKSQNGQTGQGLSADFSGDGQVTVTDFSLWKEHNGQTVLR